MEKQKDLLMHLEIEKEIQKEKYLDFLRVKQKLKDSVKVKHLDLLMDFLRVILKHLDFGLVRLKVRPKHLDFVMVKH